MSPRRLQGVALVAAALGALGVVLHAVHDPARALLAWLAAYGFGVGTALGALVLVMVLHVTGARWALVLVPRVMSIASTLPVFAVLFAPVLLGLRYVYPWSRPADPELPEPLRVALEHQRTWNEPSFFFGRSVFYLAVWCILALLLRRAHATHVRAPSPATAARQRTISGAGLPLVAFTATFASFDWFMSVQPGWVSNMYGLYFFCGGLMSALSVLAIAAWAGRRAGERLDGAHFHAVGRLMLTSVLLWAYIGFFQLLLVWMADLPREVTFYADRARGTWVVVDGLLLLGHFVVPFLALLSRPLKRRAAPLAVVGVWLLLMNAVDLAWLVLPVGGEHVHLLDLTPFLFIGGVAALHGLRHAPGARALVREPGYAESLRYRSP